jgi:hypothetical protein
LASLSTSPAGFSRQNRSTQRKIARTPDDEAALSADIIAHATQYGRDGETLDFGTQFRIAACH